MPRRLLALALAAGALALPAAPASAADCPGADTAITTLNLPAAGSAVLCIVNAERSARGLNTLTANALLQTAAQLHSDDMVARDYFDHVSPDGTDPGDRITAAGYTWGSYGENIAAGFDTPRSVMLGWMQSTGHCHNILDPGFTQLGVGVSLLAATIPGANGTWTQNFGRPLTTPPPGTDTGPRDGCPYASLQGLDAPGTAPGNGTDTTPTGGGGGTTPTSGGDTTTPSGGTDTGTGTAAPARMVVRFTRASRRLTVAGRLTNSTARTARVAVLDGTRTIARRRAKVRNGRYRVVLSLPSATAAYRLVVSAGTLRVTRPLR